MRSGAKPQIIVPAGPVKLHAPIEVLEAVEYNNLVGFAYRTLPGQSDCGGGSIHFAPAGASVWLEVRSPAAASDS